MRKTTLLILLGALGLLLLCGFGVRRWYICSWQGLCPIEQVTEENGVQLIVYSAKRKYVYKRDSLYFRVTIRNTSESIVVLHPVRCSGKPEPAISIVIAVLGEDIVWEKRHPDLAYREIVLPPGEELVFEFQIPPDEWEPEGTERLGISVRALINGDIITTERPEIFYLGNTICCIPVRLNTGEAQRFPPWASPQDAGNPRKGQVGGGLASPLFHNILYEEA